VQERDILPAHANLSYKECGVHFSANRFGSKSKK
jgi:hypothetical protein